MTQTIPKVKFNQLSIMTPKSSLSSKKQSAIPSICSRRVENSSNSLVWTTAMMFFVILVLLSTPLSVLSIPIHTGHELRTSDFPVDSNSNKYYHLKHEGRFFYPRVSQSTEEDSNDTDEKDSFKNGADSVEKNRMVLPPRFLSSGQNAAKDEDESRMESNEWETVIDPHLFLLTEWGNRNEMPSSSKRHQQRTRRNAGPSLSIVNPLDVLRQRLLLEIARRRMRQSHSQILANAAYLRNIGRRR